MGQHDFGGERGLAVRIIRRQTTVTSGLLLV